MVFVLEYDVVSVFNVYMLMIILESVYVMWDIKVMDRIVFVCIYKICYSVG